MAREGEDDLRVFRWNSVDLVVEKTWRKFLKKFGEERKRVRVFTRQLTSGRSNGALLQDRCDCIFFGSAVMTSISLIAKKGNIKRAFLFNFK